MLVNTNMIKVITLSLAISIVLAEYVGAGSERPSLRIADAISIAGKKARSEGYDLRQYQAPLVRYKSAKSSTGSWWVNYRRKNQAYTEFSIQIDDKTKKASIFLP